MTLELRPHQSEALDHLSLDPYGRDLIHVPTGGGKTIIFMQMVHDLLAAGKRSLIIVHREHLIQQVIDRFKEFYPDDRLGIVRGADRAWDAPIVVASIMTAVNDVATMPRDFELVVTDECHRSIAPSYFAIYQALGLINSELFDELMSQAVQESIATQKADEIMRKAKGIIAELQVEKGDPLYQKFMNAATAEARPLLAANQMARHQQNAVIALSDAVEGIEADTRPRKHVGFTATPQRTDKLGLGTIFSGVAYQCHIGDLVEQKLLCELDVLPAPFEGADGKKVRRSPLRAMLRDGLADQKAVDLWLEHAAESQSTIAFCMSIEHAEHLAETFQDNGIDAEPVHSKMPHEARLQNEARFRNKELPVLTNVNVFIEGFDVPRLDCIVMMRDTDSATLIPQAIGRGTRMAEGKTSCTVLDIGATIDIGELAKSVDLLRVIETVEKRSIGDPDATREKKAGQAHDMTVQEMIKVSMEVAGFDHEWAWLPYLQVHGLALNLGGDRWMRIGRQADGLFAASYDIGTDRRLVCRDQNSVADCKDLCLRDMLDNAINATFARRDAGWRSRDITPAQLTKLKSLTIDIPSNCDRGTASDLIGTYYINHSST